MGLTARKGSLEVVYALVQAHNNTRRSAGVVGAFFHADVTSDTTGDFSSLVATAVTITAANATTLPTSLTLVNQIRLRWLQHRDDAQAHKIADGTPTLTAPVATDLATAITLANEIKGDFNTHIASTTYHYTADATNTIVTADATDQTTLNALLNAVKPLFAAHLASAPAGQSIKLIDA